MFTFQCLCFQDALYRNQLLKLVLFVYWWKFISKFATMSSENDSSLGFTAFSLTESAGAIPNKQKKIKNKFEQS